MVGDDTSRHGDGVLIVSSVTMEALDRLVKDSMEPSCWEVAGVVGDMKENRFYLGCFNIGSGRWSVQSVQSGLEQR